SASTDLDFFLCIHATNSFAFSCPCCLRNFFLQILASERDSVSSQTRLSGRTVISFGLIFYISSHLRKQVLYDFQSIFKNGFNFFLIKIK
ncbi:MAG: hypothetical protein D3907_04255, partial [Candidatus Electrothrix sp. AUS3]|nr:hypothetical protein [Candidatus Electrothrix gigas]